MRAFTATIAFALAALASASSVRRQDDPPPTEAGLLHFRNSECSYADGDEGGFIEFSVLPPCNGGCGPCLGTSVFRSVIAYTPDGGPLPGYDVRAPAQADPCSELMRVYRST
jgi:hypothetical protein